MPAINPTTAMFLGAIAMAVLLLAAAAIPTLLQIRRTAAAFEEVALRLKTQIEPTLHEAQGLVRDASALARQTEADLRVVSKVVEDISDTAAYAKSLAGLIKNEVERPVLGMLSAIVGLRRGLEAFRAYRRQRGQGRRS